MTGEESDGSGGTRRELRFDGGQPRTRKAILKQVNERLKREPGIEYTRFDPGRITPTSVIGAVDPATFLGNAYPAPHATLEVWWAPKSRGNDRVRIQWYETRDAAHPEPADESDPTVPTEYTLTCGWHQDDHHDDLGPAHFQEEYPDGRTERYSVTFDDAAPIWIVSTCLERLPERLSAFRDRIDCDR